jgi:hypothetical protein
LLFSVCCVVVLLCCCVVPSFLSSGLKPATSAPQSQDPYALYSIQTAPLRSAPLRTATDISCLSPNPSDLQQKYIWHGLSHCYSVRFAQYLAHCDRPWRVAVASCRAAMTSDCV